MGDVLGMVAPVEVDRKLSARWVATRASTHRECPLMCTRSSPKSLMAGRAERLLIGLSESADPWASHPEQRAASLQIVGTVAEQSERLGRVRSATWPGVTTSHCTFSHPSRQFFFIGAQAFLCQLRNSLLARDAAAVMNRTVDRYDDDKTNTGVQRGITGVHVGLCGL